MSEDKAGQARGSSIITFPRVASIVACVLAGMALAVSLTHSGPRGYDGPPGPQGPAGPRGATGSAGTSATQQRLGICWTATASSPLLTAGYEAVQYVSVDQAIYSNGVYTCPQGETFVSIVPGPAK